MHRFKDIQEKKEHGFACLNEIKSCEELLLLKKDTWSFKNKEICYSVQFLNLFILKLLSANIHFIKIVD